MRDNGFGWDYPPGVSGNEPEIAGYPEDEDGEPLTEERLRELEEMYEPDWDAIAKEQRERDD